MVKEKRLKEIIWGFHEQTAVLLGTFALARFAKAVRRSGQTQDRETFKIYEQRFLPGGAGKIALNLTSLGAIVRAVSVIGEDDYGHILASRLAQAEVNITGILTEPSRHTPSFEQIKIPTARSATGAEIRTDVDNFAPLPPDCETALLSKIEESLEGAGVLIVSDFFEVGSPVITPGILQALKKIASTDKRPFMVSSTKRGNEFTGFTVVVSERQLLRDERSEAQGKMFPGFELVEIVAKAEQLAAEVKAPVLATLGERGAYIVETPGKGRHVPTVTLPEDANTSGAGDIFVAAAGLALATGATLDEAAFVANIAANVALRKKTPQPVATPEEIFQRFKEDFM